MADQLIEVPGQGKIAFPEGMSDNDIAAAIQKNFPNLSKYQNTQFPVAVGAAGMPEAKMILRLTLRHYKNAFLILPFLILIID